MTSPSPVPIPAALTRRYSRTAEGRAWLASLPGVIADALEAFSLVLDLAPGAEPWSGHGAVVVPVRLNDGTPGVLKAAYPHEESRTEHVALGLWEGRGAVRLIAADPEAGVLVLERLKATRSLQEVPLAAAAAVWGGLVRRLSIAPDGRPAWRGFEQVAAVAERWSDEFPERWEALGRPFPRWLLEAALEVCQTRGVVGRRSGVDVLVHADLHFLNILARPGTAAGSGDPDDYRAIDPHPLVGEAEFAVAPLLWNRLAELSAADPAAALLERCQEFGAAAGLDGDVARQWALAREVENALWYAEERNDGGRTRSLWVASTLAGRTLDGLPMPADLPVPGASSPSRG
ncbi:aminoglycoside phosphotransferase family protein [Arthrobacter sp. NPDC057259]|uniref:aminoglycoside phosphotransferase family protein n=1 Tax=Arthrobacter sp. NPDC057259 TaxID=3346073 RepID=UPI003624C305